MSWPRLLAIAIGALALASCRSVAVPPAAMSASAMVSADVEDSEAESVHGCTAGSAKGEPCRRHACEPCETAPCPPCPPLALVPPPPVPVARVCRVCDGGDGGSPAKPVGAVGIDNLTAGDTVARFQPSAEDEDTDEDACVSVANCACVCAPRFASVREIVRPHEDFAPAGPVAATLDAGPDIAASRAKSRAGTQRIPPVLARRALPELAVVESAPPMGLERQLLPGETPYVCVPAEDVLDQQPEAARTNRRPKVAIGFDVPLAWTGLSQAQVMIQEQVAETVTVDRGTAVLRLKCPGRAELSLCKTAGGKTVRAGEELDFAIALVNTGDRRLEGIVLADALPKRLAFIPDSADSTLPADFRTETGDDGSIVLKWVFKEPLEPGASGFVRFRTLVR